MDEIMESLKIIEQLIDNIPGRTLPGKKMKPIIRVPEGSYYAAVEGSRGEFGVFSKVRVTRCLIACTIALRDCHLLLQSIRFVAGAKIADLIAIGGTLTM